MPVGQVAGGIANHDLYAEDFNRLFPTFIWTSEWSFEGKTSFGNGFFEVFLIHHSWVEGGVFGGSTVLSPSVSLESREHKWDVEVEQSISKHAGDFKEKL